jgi:hypothetical protein
VLIVLVVGVVSHRRAGTLARAHAVAVSDALVDALSSYRLSTPTLPIQKYV